jgi:hypothetical protein
MLQFIKEKKADTLLQYYNFIEQYLGNENQTSLANTAINHYPQAHTLSEQFSFMVDVKTNTYIDILGVDTHLGYHHKQFTAALYIKLIHPSHKFIQSYYAQGLYHQLLHNKIKLGFMQPVFVSSIALKHIDGNYLYCKRECYPITVSTSNKLLTYFCKYTIIKPFELETFSTRIYNPIDATQPIQENIQKAIVKLFATDNPFSYQEIKILKMYSEKASITNDKIAQQMNIDKRTVDSYNRRILQKANDFFEIEFINAKMVAAHLKKLILI